MIIDCGMAQRTWINSFSGKLLEYVYKKYGNLFYYHGFYPWFMLVAVVGALICGMNGFAYLHSRKQMDFYKSCLLNCTLNSGGQECTQQV